MKNKIQASTFGCGILSLLILLTANLYVPPAFADEVFDPEILSQSTVRILVKHKKKVVSAASGFVWQKDNQIVTSLHVIHPDPKSKIIVEFGRKKRKATILAVLAHADLVLLEVKKPIAGWKPLQHFNGEKPKYKDEVSALGFNRGSAAMSTRELRKGFVKPETLEMLLPPDAVSNLKKSNVLDLSLPIYYLDGSLLPGYSGSPIVDATGKLIGVGDGGLENGASSVSWVIPASNIDQLTQSSNRTLPANIKSTYKAFTADNIAGGSSGKASISPTYFDVAYNGLVGKLRGYFDYRSILHKLRPTSLGVYQRYGSKLLYIALGQNFNFNTPTLSLSANSMQVASNNNADTNFDDELESDTLDDRVWQQDYQEVIYREFSFVKTKSRTFQQMLGTSSTPELMDSVKQISNELFHGIKVNYKNFSFDVYEDSRYGLNLVVPSEVALVVDDEYLLVEGDMFCRNCPYEIQYHVRSLNDKTQEMISQSPDSFLGYIAAQHLDELNEEGWYGEYEKFRSIEPFGSNRYVLRTAFSDFAGSYQDNYEFNYFIAATNRDAWFQVQGILNRFDDEFISDLKKYQGTDCTASNVSNNVVAICQDIETMLKILISTHLTTFSNKFMHQSSSRE